MILSMIVGAFLTAVSIGFHAVCTSAWISYLRKRARKPHSYLGEFLILSTTAVVLLVVHTVEVMFWAITYYLLVGSNQLDNLEEAVYFSTVTFTSLGYGDVVIEGSWRMLSAFQAMTGLLIFGWSTALLFAVVQNIWQRKFTHA